MGNIWVLIAPFRYFFPFTFNAGERPPSNDGAKTGRQFRSFVERGFEPATTENILGASFKIVLSPNHCTLGLRPIQTLFCTTGSECHDCLSL